jgi:hypothetical protein
MSEQEITENTTAEQVTADVTGAEPQGTETETDWKSEARKWESRAKKAAADTADAAKWREYEQAQKPEQERQAEKLAQAEADAAAAKATLLKYEVASTKGIPSEAMQLLTGSTKEELEAAADTLLGLIADQSKPKTPRPDQNQGKPAAGGTSTADQFAAALGNIL